MIIAIAVGQWSWICVKGYPGMRAIRLNLFQIKIKIRATFEGGPFFGPIIFISALQNETLHANIYLY